MVRHRHAAASWAPTTVRQTRSVLDRYLHPQLGDLRVGAITPAVIDTCYARLRREGGARGQPLAAGSPRADTILALARWFCPVHFYRESARGVS